MGNKRQTEVVDKIKLVKESNKKKVIYIIYRLIKNTNFNFIRLKMSLLKNHCLLLLLVKLELEKQLLPII